MHSRTVLGPCKLERRVGRVPRRQPTAPAPAIVTFAVSLSFGASSAAIAGPTGGTVVQGQGSISAPSSSQTVINQSSQQLTLNWSSFNVGASESVRFYQPSSSAIAFNRILGQSASQIFGQIDANGKVVLVNPNGVLIGRTAQLNVSSLVVSSLDAIDFNAASGRYRFSATRNDPGAVVNEGTITAQPGGSVTLLGGSVSNSGTIVADYGTVNLAAGRMATLDLAGDGLLRLEVGGDLATNDAGVASAVENSGSVIANGGHVLLTASAVKNMFENLVNNTGVVRANRIDNSGGTIELLGPGGTVLSSGTLDASAGDAVSTGGTVSVLGDHVGLLRNAVVNVSGATGGGTALIGGDTHGANPDVLDATETYVSSGATLNADAGATGDGGRIVVWSNDFTRYFGSLSARGGTLWGNGGFAEVSGKQTLEFLGHADLTSAHGTWGTLLLDPDDITIDGSSDTPSGGFTGGDFTASGTTPINIGALTIETLLNTTNVQLTTTGSISNIAGPGGLNGTIDVTTTGNSGVSLSLSAGTGITLNYPVLTHNGAISLTTSGGDITLQGSSSLNAGSALITMEADSGSIVSSNGGLVTAASLHFTAGGSIGTASNPINTVLGGSGSTQSIYAVANGGDVYVAPTSAVELTTAVATNTVNVTGSGNITADVVEGTAVTLDSTGGSILSNGTGNTPVIIASGALALEAQEGIGAAPTDFTNLASGHSVVVQAFSGVTAQVADPAGNINFTIANPTPPPPLAAGSVQLGTVPGTRTGSVVVQSTGNLSADAGSIVLGSGANTATVVLSAPAATLTLDSGGNVTDHPAATLLLSARDILSSGGTPHTLGIAAGDLIFNATSPSGNVTLNTSVTQLDSTLGGAASLAVNQSASPSGSLALGDISVGGGLSVSTSGTSPGIAVNGDVSVTGTASLNATGNIGVGASGTVSGSSVSLIAGQNITAATGSEVNSGTIILQGQAIGTSVAPVSTESSGTTHLTTTSSGGGAYVQHSGVLNLTASDASGGAVNVSTTGAGSAMTVASASGIGVALSTSGANSSLTTTGLVSGGSGGVSLTTSGTGSGISVDNGVSGTGAGTVSIAATGAGSDVSLNSSISAPAGVTITAGSASTSWNSITEGGVEQINSVGTLTMTAGAIGTGLAPLNTTVGKLDATAKAVNGGIFINQSGALEVVNANATGGGSVSITTGQAPAAGGTITVDSASGDGVTLTAGGAGSAVNIASGGIVSGGATGVNLDAGGAITAGTGSSVSGDFVTMTGSAIGTSTAVVNTASDVAPIAFVNLTSTGGGIYVAHDGNLNLTANAGGGGPVDVAASGSMTVASVTGAGVALSTSGSFNNLDVAGPVNGGAGAVSLLASGLLTAGTGELVTTTNTLTATGTSVGDSGTSVFNTAVGKLNATATNSTNGVVYIGQSGALELIDASAVGAVSVTTGQGSASGGAITVDAASGNGVTLTAGGVGSGISLTGTVSGGAGGATLTAGGAITAASGSSVSGNSIDLTGTAVGTNTAAVKTASVGGGPAASLTASGAGGIYIQHTGNVSVSNLNGGSSAVSLIASGAITAGAGEQVTTTNTFTVSGTSIGVNGTPLNTTVGALDAGATSGGIFVNQTGALELIDADATGAVAVQTSGALTVDAATGSSVTLNAAGAITAAPGSSITGTSINLTGSAIGTSAATVDTASVGGGTTSLTATSTSPTAGGIYIQHTGDASLAADAATGAVNVGTTGALTVTAATGTSATLSSGTGQSLNVDGSINVGAGTVALVAGGAITAGGSNLITASTLTGSGTSLGASGARLNTAVGLLNTGSTNGGTYITQAGDVTVESTAANGPVDVQTTNGSIDEILASGIGIRLAAGGAGKNITVNSALTGGAGDVTLAATGDGGNVVLNNPVSTTGNVTIAAGSPTSGGVISVNGGASISGDAVTVSALSIGAPGSPFVANATTLNATSTAGGIYVMPNGGLSLTANATGGPVDVETLGGPLTVASASGDGVTLATNGDGNALTTNGTVDGRAGGVTLTTSGVGSDIVVNGGVNGTAGVTFMASGAASNIDLSGAVTSAGTVSMSSTGAIVAGVGNNVTGAAVTLLGAAIGASGTPLNMATHSLNATTLGGDLYVQQLGDLTLTAHATGGVLDVESTNGALDVLSASGGGVKLVSGGGGKDVDLNGAVDGGSGTVTLTAGGNVVAGAGEAVTGASLTASGASIGAVGAPLVTAVTGLGATATTGGIFVNNTGVLALSASAPNGAVAVNNSGALTISSAAGNGVTLTTANAGSDINVSGPVSGGTADIDLLTYGGGGNISLGGAVTTAANVTLMAGTAASPGAILAAAGNQITANLLTATGSSIGAGGVALNTTVGSLNATSYNGNINVRETDGLDLNASATGGSLTVTTVNGPLTVESANGTGIALAAGGAGGVITLNGFVTGGAGDVSLTSGGALVAGTGSQVIGNNLTISASQIGASGAKLNTAVNSLDASASSGGIFVAQTGSLALNAVATGGALDVEASNGAITVSAASGSGVTIAANGDGDGLSMNGLVNGGAGTVSLTTNGAGADIALNGVLSTTGRVSVTANGGAIAAGAGNSVTAGAVDLLGASIGATGDALNSTTSTLSATATNGGIFVNNTGALELTANATSGLVDVGTSGALTVTSAGGYGVTLTTSDAGAGITVNGAVNGGPGAVTLAATGTGSGITLNNTLDASGAVTLTAGTSSGGGAIVGGAGSHISGSSLTAKGSAIGTSMSPLKTSVASLQTTSTNGGTYVDEADAVTLTASATGGALDVQTDNGALVVAGATGAGIALTAGGAGSGIALNGVVNAGAEDVTLTAGTATSRGAVVAGAGANVSGATFSVQAASIGSSAMSLNTNIGTLTASASTGDIDIVQQKALNLASVQAAGSLNVTAAGGDITVGKVSAGNSATLTANSGAIADDGDNTTRLTANSATLQARSIGAPSTLVGATVDSKLRLDTDVNDLVATSTAGGVYINQQQGLASAAVHASGGKAGNIELLTAKGDLNIQSVTASGTVLLAAGANLYALPGSGPITAQAAELRAGGADPTSGHIGTLSHPLVLELSPGATLRMFVPQTVNANNSAGGPATLPSAGVESTLSLFAAPNGLAVDAGFGQFQGLGETQFTSQAELLVHSIQNQTAAVQTVLGLDWNSFNPNVSLFGKLDPSVCLPSDQRDEEEGASETSQKCVAK